ncbi:MAG: transcriptional repressor [Acidimicrobiia bacterium]|nr:transcriptional repressor [Acidimicrobiia bacterium]MBA3983249.1 transcriptional repressor [Acidimicrobiia bacterium]MDQ3392372.1 transcriptional repressor [Actinomycetota bacterium]
MRDLKAERILERLRESGGRVTSARRLIVEAMLAGGDHHLTAADIVEIVRRDDPVFHESTVYRTLERLTELGIVRPVQLVPGATVFHLVENAHRHNHLVCDDCGTIIEARVDLLDVLASDVARNHRFTLQTEAAPLHGRCEACQHADAASNRAADPAP